MTEIAKTKADDTGCCKPVSPRETRHFTGCLLCGKPLRYEKEASFRRCEICGKKFSANCTCEDGHFICDACHEASSIAFFVPVLLASTEKDPLQLFEEIIALPQVHMHGPEHHIIVPCVLLTAYRNNGGDLELNAALREAVRRGKQVPGGACGYLGACGAAIGAGIYMSVLLGSNPVHKEAWPIPQRLTADCLGEIADVGGPRCCKRTARLAITRAAEFTGELLGLDMPLGKTQCRYFRENGECLLRDCPFFPEK